MILSCSLHGDSISHCFHLIEYAWNPSRGTCFNYYLYEFTVKSKKKKKRRKEENKMNNINDMNNIITTRKSDI